jgi:hypothetical protein
LGLVVKPRVNERCRPYKQESDDQSVDLHYPKAGFRGLGHEASMDVSVIEVSGQEIDDSAGKVNETKKSLGKK